MTMSVRELELAAPVALAARLMMALLFVVEGIGKMGSYPDVQNYMSQFGVDPRLLPLVILTEFGGGILITLGAFSRLASIALAGFCILTAVFFHRGADAVVEFQKNLAIAGGFLVLAANGPGAWSLDAWCLRPKTRIIADSQTQ
jgi:putative oxidoreductase